MALSIVFLVCKQIFGMPMDISFLEPRLDILYLFREAEISGDGEPLRKYLVDRGNVFLYKHFGEKNVFSTYRDDVLHMEESNKRIVAKLSAEMETEAENETALFTIQVKLAEHYAQIMCTEEFGKLTRKLTEVDPSISFKMDICFCRIRMAIILENQKQLVHTVKEASYLAESMSDWDRKNRFKAYLGLYHIMKADFRGAADFFRGFISTHNAPELFDFDRSVLYYTVSALLAYNRKELKEHVIDNCEVLKCEGYVRFARSYYDCDYYNVFPNLLRYIYMFKDDYFIGGYGNHFCKEMKMAAYNQLLQSYQSLHLDKMAAVFRVRREHVEKDLVQFITEDRMHCVIDQIEGVVRVAEKKDEDKTVRMLAKGESLVRFIKKSIYRG